MERFLKVMSYFLAAVLGFAVAVAVFVGIGLIPVDPGFSKLEQLQQLELEEGDSLPSAVQKEGGNGHRVSHSQ